jgi:putative ABC transport system permease protein
VDNLEVLKYKLTKGRFFSHDYPSDTTAVVINEAAVKLFGWTDPIGKEMLTTIGGNEQSFEVIGVVRDFNFQSLHTTVQPIVMRFTNSADYLLVRYQGDPNELISSIHAEWKKVAQGEYFDYKFMDEKFNALFKVESQAGLILFVLTIQAITIMTMGILALISYLSYQRSKEFSIRKVLGASAWQIVRILSGDFVKLFLIAFFPACVLGYYFSNEWLATFEYHVNISTTLFIVTAITCLSIIAITISFHSIKIAHENPVKALRQK